MSRLDLRVNSDAILDVGYRDANSAIERGQRRQFVQCGGPLLRPLAEGHSGCGGWFSGVTHCTMTRPAGLSQRPSRHASCASSHATPTAAALARHCAGGGRIVLGPEAQS